MIRDLMIGGASVEDTLTLWDSALVDVKQRIRPLFTQGRVAASAGQFLDGLLGNEPRKTGWMRAEAAGDPGPWRQQAIVGRGRRDCTVLHFKSRRPRKMKIVIYTRVSTHEQAAEGLSLDAQEEQCRGYAKSQRTTGNVEVVVEKGVSGSIPVADRPMGGAMLERLKKGDGLIAAKLDRLFRSPTDA